jgi:hypothetical protein
MADAVRDACEACFATNADDCSGFVNTVATQLGVGLEGLADQIVDTIRGGDGCYSFRATGNRLPRQRRGARTCAGNGGARESAHYEALRPNKGTAYAR